MLFGLLTRRERWGLSARGWLLLLVTVAATAFALVRTIHPFLAVTARSDTDVLVVEGWIHDYAIRAARDEFQSGRYQRVFSTGGPVQGIAAYINDYSTSAHIGAARLTREGIPADRVQSVPSRETARDRTFHAAIALRDWLHARQIPVRSLNVVTQDVHARRSRLLYQAAFGPEVSVGIIAVPNPDYDSRRWWRFSQGVRDVIGETISYLYAKLFFHPDAAPRAVPPISPTS